MTQPSLLDLPVSRPKPNPVAQERRRLNAAALRLLDYLKARPGQWVPNHELCEPSVGGNRAIGARMPELKADGWIFDKRHVKDGCWEYRLRGRKEW
jgi:hypothetical protein